LGKWAANERKVIDLKIEKIRQGIKRQLFDEFSSRKSCTKL
jgi:type III secretory pathway component EscV